MKLKHYQFILAVALFVLAAGVLTACAKPSEAPVPVDFTNSAPSAAVCNPIIITWELDAEESMHEVIREFPGVIVDYDDCDFTVIKPINASYPENTEEFLLSCPGVKTYEYDSVDLVLSSASISNDYFSNRQWSLNNDGSHPLLDGAGSDVILTTPDIDIDAPEGWKLYREDEDKKRRVIVAVIDTGVDYTHSDLASSIWINPSEIAGNGIDDDNNGYIDDIYGWDFYNGDNTICHYEYNEQHNTLLSSSVDNDNHGTHCAGIIAATIDNKIGIAGVASVGDVKIMALKIHGGTDRKGSITDAIKAIKYAEMMGAEVCNLSWGSYTDSPALYTAIERSRMLFICAAGNDGINNDELPLYPASFNLSNIISVTSVDKNGNLTEHSNYGAESVDIAVPGVDIVSTVVGSFATMSGSSMAAPHVSGIAALLYTYKEGLFAKNVRDIIFESIKPVDSLDDKIAYPGIPSLSNALALSMDLLSDLTVPTISVSRSFSEDNLLLSVSAADTGYSGVHLIRYAYGFKNIEYFANGTAGTIVSDNVASVAKSGKYTFFAIDKAGNECIKQLYIVDDVIPPSISNVNLSVNNKRTSLTISANVSDSQSGLKVVKYMKGRLAASAFLSAGEELIWDASGNITFKTEEEDTYTIYACDHRGNKSVYYAMAYIRPSTSVTLSEHSLTLETGDAYKLETSLLPARTTDKIVYSSSDKSVATVSGKGNVTAVSKGTCIITATTSSGLTDTCEITVVEP